jgi:hypothetical protein
MRHGDSMFAHPYQFTPDCGPCEGHLMILPRRYDAFTGRGKGEPGLYVWSDQKEGYVWVEGVTLDQWMADAV